jgi:hypothetical protein
MLVECLQSPARINSVGEEPNDRRLIGEARWLTAEKISEHTSSSNPAHRAPLIATAGATAQFVCLL